jgi:hypothetical protein
MKKIKKFKFGLKQVIGEVFTGLLTTFVLTMLANQGWLPDNVLLIINIVLIVGNILLIRKMWSWGVFYTVGWLIGSIVFFQIGLFSTWQIILYLVLPIAALVMRVVSSAKRGLAG